MTQTSHLLLLALFSACAPPASFRPASAAMGDKSNEMGMGLAAIGPRPYVDESADLVSQLWASRRVSKHLKLSAVAAMDTEAIAAGGAFAWLPIDAKGVTAGIEAEIGYAWLAFGLPLAVELPGDLLSFYAAPRLGTWGDSLMPAIPVGIDMHITRKWALRAEAQISWADFKYYNRRLQGGLALAYQFGAASK